jgi:DNA-binding protein H-NS
MRGAQQRIHSLEERRDALRTIIRNKYQVLENEADGSSKLRKLNRVELKEFRSRLAEVKTELLTAKDEYRQYKEQFDAAATSNHKASVKKLQDRRSFDRAKRKAPVVLANGKKLFEEAAKNGSRAAVEEIRKQALSGNAKGAKAGLKQLFIDKNLPGYAEVMVSGMVNERVLDRMADAVQQMPWVDEPPSQQVITSLTK